MARLTKIHANLIGNVLKKCSVKALLQRLPKTIEVAVFVDADPAGIQIALTTPKVTQILAPDITKLSLLIKSSSSSEHFDDQHQQVKYIQNHKDDW